MPLGYPFLCRTKSLVSHSGVLGKVGDETGYAKNDDALLELRTGAEQGGFDILFVSKFACIGRVPLECSFAAAFFERSGVEVWDTATGHIGLCAFALSN